MATGAPWLLASSEMRFINQQQHNNTSNNSNIYADGHDKQTTMTIKRNKRVNTAISWIIYLVDDVRFQPKHHHHLQRRWTKLLRHRVLVCCCYCRHRVRHNPPFG
ncbi:unnamed protein product, partial [Ceratitis capitata]